MNCPVRTDEDYLEHPEYNQNPPFLAPELTTNKDLNGTVNSREHDESDVGNDFLLNATSSVQNTLIDAPENCEDAQCAGTWSFKTSPRTLMDYGGEDQVHLHDSLSRLTSAKSGSGNLIQWLSTVALCSIVSFVVGTQWVTGRKQPVEVANFVPHHVTMPIYRRASTCPGDLDTSENHYNTPLQVGAVFIILSVSGLACSFPTLAKHFPGLRLSPRFFFAVRHFGTGVLIATAFVHLLPTAFISLGDPCLSGFWTNDYPAMPGAISLAGIFLVVIIEMVFHPGRRCTSMSDQSHNSQVMRTEPDEEAKAGAVKPVQELEPIPLPMTRPLGGRHSSIGRTISANLAITDAPGQPDQKATLTQDAKAATESLSSLADEQKLRKDRLQCVLLEVGILFHSVFIGMALSVSTGSDFVVLLIAISFHQTFEGLALGSRIASIAWPKKTFQPWLMCFAYGCTTPIGQAIGLGMRSMYSPDSQAGLLLVGIMNAISAGLLIFASLVELLSEDFLSDESWNHLRGKKRVVACFIVFLGAFLMALIGAWA